MHYTPKGIDHHWIDHAVRLRAAGRSIEEIGCRFEKEPSQVARALKDRENPVPRQINPPWIDEAYAMWLEGKGYSEIAKFHDKEYGRVRSAICRRRVKDDDAGIDWLNPPPPPAKKPEPDPEAVRELRAKGMRTTHIAAMLRLPYRVVEQLGRNA
jgi:hypothetical protein